MRNSAVCAITIYGKTLHKNGFITTKLQMLNYEHLSVPVLPSSGSKGQTAMQSISAKAPLAMIYFLINITTLSN